MAARRISKSSVDWATFYQKVPARERELYRALKNRNDSFVNRVHSNPESLGKIDFAHYRNRLPGLKMVDTFEQEYSKVSVPYPKDSQGMGQTLAEEEKKALADSASRVKQLENEKVLSVAYLKKLDELPKLEDFTMEMLEDYFPWSNMVAENPRIYPFTEEHQLHNLEHNELKGLNNLLRRLGLKKSN